MCTVGKTDIHTWMKTSKLNKILLSIYVVYTVGDIFISVERTQVYGQEILISVEWIKY